MPSVKLGQGRPPHRRGGPPAGRHAAGRFNGRSRKAWSGHCGHGGPGRAVRGADAPASW